MNTPGFSLAFSRGICDALRGLGVLRSFSNINILSLRPFGGEQSPKGKELPRPGSLPCAAPPPLNNLETKSIHLVLRGDILITFVRKQLFSSTQTVFNLRCLQTRLMFISNQLNS